MELKTLEKLQNIVVKIKQLDTEIAKLEALAMQAANGESMVTVKFDVIDLVKKEDQGNKVKLDEDGSLSSKSVFTSLAEEIHKYRWQMLAGIDLNKKKEDGSLSSFTEQVRDTLALQMFGLLIHYKQSERQSLLNQLQRHGVKI